MMKQKNILTLVLMGSSIALLLLLQFFWLRGAYKDAAHDFRRETSSLFRNTIFALHDSLIQESLTAVEEEDSLRGRVKIRGFRHVRLDSVNIRKLTDSTLKGFPEKSMSIEIISAEGKTDDAFRKILRPLAARIKEDKEPKRFVFRMLSDSLNKDSVRFHFSKALKDAGITTAYQVLSVSGDNSRKTQDGWRIDLPEGQFTSELVPFTPLTHYAATFEGVPSFLIRKITPQILFSIFLTLLTVISFYVMYRNLRAQQRLMDIKNDFISNVTHELKTPVATVSVALEALKNFKALDDPKRTTEYLEIAQNELNRLTLMTDKILKTSVYEDLGIDLRKDNIDLDEIIEQVLGSMKLVFEKRRTKLSYQKSGTDFHFHGSHTHLTNVLYNLVDNALKYSEENSSLDISLKSSDDSFQLIVSDSGPGIPQEYQKKIFEKFFRVPSGDVHNIKGYGLGLSYVAGVVKSHGGNISVQSEVGKGSAFIINLPKHTA